MMKKALIFTLTVLVVLLAGCGVMPADEKESATQSQTVSFPAGNETVSEQEPTEAEKDDQTIRMRKFFGEGKLTTEAIQAIMSEEKPNQREKIVLRGDRVRQLIPKNISVSQTEDYVCKALEHYNNFLRRRAERDER